MAIKNCYMQKIADKKEFWLAGGAILLALVGCSIFTPDAATATPAPVPGVNELHFKDAVTGQRFRSLDGTIQGLADKTWWTTSYQLHGNFYESRWCSGAGASPDCQTGGASEDNPDQHLVNLYTLFYSQDFPQVFGLGFQALWVPRKAGWGASFFFAEGGERVVGEGWGVNFKEYPGANARPETTISLGNSYTYPIQPNAIDYSSGQPLRQDLGLYLANPEAMRDRGLAQIQALAQKVKMEISSHRVMTCDMQPYGGKGIPPKCIPRLMTAGEETAELARAETFFADQQKLLNDHYQEMYAAWMSAFPFNRDWP